MKDTTHDPTRFARTPARVGRRAGSLLAAAFLAVSLTACGSSDSTSAVPADCEPAHNIKTLEKGVLTVAVIDVMPYGGTTQDGSITGVDGEIVTKIAAMECLDVKPLAVDGSALIPSVQTGKADIGMGDWYRTPERLAEMTMSEGLYMDINSLVSKSEVQFTDLKDLNVGAVSGYNFTDPLKAYLGGDLNLYDGAQAMYQDLKAGRIDVATDSAASASFLVGSDFTVTIPDPVPAEMGTSFDPTAAGLPIFDGSEGLEEAINEDLAKLRTDGDLQKIAEKYGLPASALNVTN